MAAKKRKSTSRLASLGALPMFGFAAGAVWLLYRTFQIRGGKEWRGYSGTVVLKPGLVYRFDLVAPSVSSTEQGTIESKLASDGARNFLWNLLPNETHLYFDQSFPEGATLTFGKGGLQTATGSYLLPLTARRLDGLDWEAP